MLSTNRTSSENQIAKIVIVSVLILSIALDAYRRLYQYWNTEREMDSLITGYAFTLLICFLIYRFYEKGGHWLLIPIIFILSSRVFALSLLFSRTIDLSPALQKILNANFALELILVTTLIYSYVKVLRKNTD